MSTTRMIHVNTMNMLFFHIEDQSVLTVQFTFLVSRECRMTVSRQSIVKIISQSNLEIGCSLMGQWDYTRKGEIGGGGLK